MIIDLNRDEIGLVLSSLKIASTDIGPIDPELSTVLESLVSKIFDQIEP